MSHLDQNGLLDLSYFQYDSVVNALDPLKELPF